MASHAEKKTDKEKKEETRETGETKKTENIKKTKKSAGAVLCRSLGTILLAALVLVCLPLTVPRLFGYHIYSVVSGSMEPAIPTGSLVYIRETAPEDVEADDVIAFYSSADSASIITHRVVENRVLMGEFITKGDANEERDVNPVSYSEFIGKVEHVIPGAGGIAEALTGPFGRRAAGSAIALAAVFLAAGSLLERSGRRKRTQTKEGGRQ